MKKPGAALESKGHCIKLSLIWLEDLWDYLKDSLCFKTQKATDCDVYSGSISPGHRPLAKGEEGGEK